MTLLEPVRESGPEEDILAVSRGNVVQVRPGGPVFGPPKPERALRESLFVSTLGSRDRTLVALLSVGWLICFIAFWLWWLEPGHRVGTFGFIVNSVILLYFTSVPVYFIVAVTYLRQIDPAIEVPALRIAFVVTKAPSESWFTARNTLTAMLTQDCVVPYDVWLCDEAPDDEVRTWCAANGVRLSTRFGVAEYHRDTWPRRTKCKEGNLAYFYDHWGYQDYDVVAQLDCDHVPAPTYLSAMVRPFTDPAVGYVAAPSVCDLNAANSWAARGRLYREATWHGPIQLGHNVGLAPMCIGSHYAVRTEALRDIGGLGPELAEDFSTTFLLNSAGWQGCFAIDAPARGEGPLTFADMLTQEFQWSRSLTTLLFALFPPHLRRLNLGLKLRFVFALCYYPLLTGSTAAGLALPVIAAVGGVPWVKVNYLAFLAHMGSLSIWLILLALLFRRRGLLRPQSVPLVSWENWLFTFTRWPYVGLGIVCAVIQQVRPRQLTFRVTPKGGAGVQHLPTRLTAPYTVISLVLSLAALTGERLSPTVGYVLLCILGATCYCIVGLAVPLLHAKEAGRAFGLPVTAALRTARGSIWIGMIAIVPLALAIAGYPAYAIRILGW
ncbi:glycosyltransferase family 2 protein [Catenulispora subtropica]|uniref:Glycosyltransferase n=1 Tax=Catenulispora subtropica TaxID=450798 RepID=A0ABN2QC68_9ACTN